MGGAYAGKCSYGKLSPDYYDGATRHRVFDVCTVSNDDQWLPSYKFVCDSSNRKVNQIFYSRYNCSDVNQEVVDDVTEFFEEIYCEPRDECDYVEFGEWLPTKDNTGIRCGLGIPTEENEYDSQILSTLDYIGHCIATPDGGAVTFSVNSCEPGIRNNRFHSKRYDNPDCKGIPIEEITMDDDGENDGPFEQDGECSRFIKCSTNDIAGITYNSANIMNTKFTMICVFIMVIQQIFCLF